MWGAGGLAKSRETQMGEERQNKHLFADIFCGQFLVRLFVNLIFL